MPAKRRGLLAAVVVLGTSGAIAAGSLPAPGLLIGFVSSVTIALLLNVSLVVPTWTFRGSQTVLGAAVASQIDFSAWASAQAQFPAIAVASTATIVVALGLGLPLRRHGVTPLTAVLASVPGGAATATAMAKDLGADQRVVVVVQFLRLSAVIMTLPLLLAFVFQISTSVAPSSSAGLKAWVFVGASSVGGLVAGRLFRLPAPDILGALIVGTLLRLTPTFDSIAVPSVALYGVLLIVGLASGGGLTRDAVGVLRPILPQALIASLLLIALCGAIAVPFAAWTRTSYLDSYLATSPGGLAVVLAACLDSGGDVSLVSVTQVVRTLAILIVVPVIVQIRRRRP